MTNKEYMRYYRQNNREAIAESKRKYYEEHKDTAVLYKNNKRLDKNCKGCGVLMPDVHYQQEFCKECAAGRKMAAIKEYKKKVAEQRKITEHMVIKPIRLPRKLTSHQQIVKINEFARWDGLSYGKYVAKKGI